MKNRIQKQVLVIVLLSVSITAFSQMKVYTNNNVGIGTTSTVNSKLSVNTTGTTSWAAYIYNPSVASGHGALVAKREKPTSGSHTGIGLYGICYAGNGYAYGTRGYAYSSTATSTGRSYGIWGYAGNATTGYNYGVYGRLVGSNNGAGVFGALTGDTKITGKYAGYFHGNTKVQGTLWVGSTAYTSDSIAKKDIRDLEGGNLEKLMTVKGVKYKYKTPEEMGLIGTEVTDTSSTNKSMEMEEYYNQDRIGVLAQEIQVVYPDLVNVDQQGVLGVDYIGLIPILIESLKEQHALVDTLTTEIETMQNDIKKLKRQVKKLKAYH